jgi:predicted nuclease of predicted toxin-antitoxin system
MRAKLDENLPIEAAELMRTAGWECDTMYDEGLAGADDSRVAAACQAGARVLFTLDLDFADIRTYPPSEYVGIVVLRPAEATRRQTVELITRVLPVLSTEWIEHRLWIVEPARVRVRGAKEPASDDSYNRRRLDGSV